MANITKFEWLNDTSNGTIVKVESPNGNYDIEIIDIF